MKKRSQQKNLSEIQFTIFYSKDVFLKQDKRDRTTDDKLMKYQIHSIHLHITVLLFRLQIIIRRRKLNLFRLLNSPIHRIAKVLERKGYCNCRKNCFTLNFHENNKYHALNI